MSSPTVLPQAVSDYPCEKCGHMMRIRRAHDGNVFYGCSSWPDCNFSFDANQLSGAPIAHQRYGVPFRPRVLEDTHSRLFEAIKGDSFSLEKGQLLVQAAAESQANRRLIIRELEHAQVQKRAARADPKTPDEWLDFVLKERLRAVTDHLLEEKRLYSKGIENEIRRRRTR